MVAQHAVSQVLLVKHASQEKPYASRPLIVSEPSAQDAKDSTSICPGPQDLDEMGAGNCIVAESVAHEEDKAG